jgi:hypothetical protein
VDDDEVEAQIEHNMQVDYIEVTWINTNMTTIIILAPGTQ